MQLLSLIYPIVIYIYKLQKINCIKHLIKMAGIQRVKYFIIFNNIIILYVPIIHIFILCELETYRFNINCIIYNSITRIILLYNIIILSEGF